MGTDEGAGGFGGGGHGGPEAHRAGLQATRNRHVEEQGGFAAANGSKIENYGERRMSGHADEGEGVSLRMTRADVHKVLGTVRQMNKGGNVAVFDGEHSYVKNKRAGQKTKSLSRTGNASCTCGCLRGPKKLRRRWPAS